MTKYPLWIYVKQITLRLKHKLTAYHFRHNLEGGNKLAVCSCGWKCRIVKKGLKDYLRRSKCLRGHIWEPWEPIEVGEVYEKDGEWTSSIDEGHGSVIAYMRQCNVCYTCESNSKIGKVAQR